MDMTLERDDLIQDKLFIGGQWRAGVEGKSFAVSNPATGRTIATLVDGGTTDAIAAVDAAQQAFIVWRAEDTPFGLAAYFYSRDAARIWRVADALETGMVAINDGMLSTEVAPFGGVKESGYGREGSRYGLAEFQHMKYLSLGGLDA